MAKRTSTTPLHTAYCALRCALHTLWPLLGGRPVERDGARMPNGVLPVLEVAGDRHDQDHPRGGRVGDFQLRHDVGEHPQKSVAGSRDPVVVVGLGWSCQRTHQENPFFAEGFLDQAEKILKRDRDEFRNFLPVLPKTSLHVRLQAVHTALKSPLSVYITRETFLCKR